MRMLATLLNLGLLLVLSFLLADEGLPNKKEALIVFLAFAAPAASLIALYRTRGVSGTGLVSLFFERKRLEEKARINILRSSNNA